MDAFANGRRIGLALLTVTLLILMVAPIVLLDPPPRTGRPALAAYRRWLVGELDVSSDWADRMRAGFTVTVDERRTVLGSRDDDGLCWTLLLPADGSAPLGPSVGDDEFCGQPG